MHSILSPLEWINSHPALAGASVAIASAWIAIVSLRANHDWNRRQYALNLVGDWNAKTEPHQKAIEGAFPGILNINEDGMPVAEFTLKRAVEVYNATSGDDYNLRFHLLQMGNHLEFIASAYLNYVGDRKIIEVAFGNVIVRWYDAMHNFTEVIKMKRKYAPWRPFYDLTLKWKTRGYGNATIKHENVSPTDGTFIRLNRALQAFSKAFRADEE
jgi:hypothetical protein